MLDIEVMSPCEIDDFLTKVCEGFDVNLSTQEKIDLIQKHLRWIGTIYE